MEIDQNNSYTISPDVLFQDVNGEVVLLDMASEKYFGLDAIGARIWGLLNAGNHVGGIIDTLHDEYEVDRATLEADVAELVGTLAEAGLITATCHAE